MTSNLTEQTENEVTVPSNPQLLAEFAGTPEEFWRLFLQTTASETGAVAAILLHSDGSGKWNTVNLWLGAGVSRNLLQNLRKTAIELTKLCLEKGVVIREFNAFEPDSNVRGKSIVMLRAGLSNTAAKAVIAYAASTEVDSSSVLTQLVNYLQVPSAYETGRLLRQSAIDVQQFASILDLSVLLNQENAFMPAAMVLCNELANRFNCQRVSLGWEKSVYVQVQCISHTEKFSRKIDAIRHLEDVMEECLHQDEELLWPSSEENPAVVRNHGWFAQHYAVPFLCSVPLRDEDKPTAVLLLERSDKPFSLTELNHLRLTADHVTTRLADLKKVSDFFLKRWARNALDAADYLVGPEHTLTKLLSIFCLALILCLIFVKMDYRIKAPFVVRTEQAMLISSPFEGFISKVYAESGDRVVKDQVLLEIETQDIKLEEAAALAEKEQHLKEADRARAENELAQMRVALAKADQIEARLKRIHYRLQQAQIAAPFAGVLTEGELRDKIGAPVGTGDLLFKIARLDTLYVEMDVDEADVARISTGLPARIAFTSQPDAQHQINLKRVSPSAETKDGANIFRVKAEFTDAAPFWCQPGMTGLGKIYAGKRSLIWIFTHKTIDFIRLRLWL